MADLRQLGMDKTRARKGAVRPELTPSQIRGLLADVATGGGVPFIDAASQAAQGNYGQAAISGLLDAPPVKMAGMALAPIAGIFIGPKSKLWNNDLAKMFENLEKQGVSNKDAYLQTGTFRSPDGKLRQEISDEDFNFRLNFESTLPNKLNQYKSGTDLPIGGAFEHKLLFSSYPDALKKYRADIGMSPNWMPDSSAYGEFNPSKALVTVRNKSKENAKKTAIHELQHLIQGVEGFSSGGTIGPGENAIENYRRLAGEAEARAVEARLPLTMEQRKKLFPLESYDIPIEGLIR